jgi:hypothetical protein
MGNTKSASTNSDPGILTVSERKAASVHSGVAALERLPASRPILPAMAQVSDPTMATPGSDTIAMAIQAQTDAIEAAHGRVRAHFAPQVDVLLMTQHEIPASMQADLQCLQAAATKMTMAVTDMDELNKELNSGTLYFLLLSARYFYHFNHVKRSCLQSKIFI